MGGWVERRLWTVGRLRRRVCERERLGRDGGWGGCRGGLEVGGRGLRRCFLRGRVMGVDRFMVGRWSAEEMRGMTFWEEGVDGGGGWRDRRGEWVIGAPVAAAD